MIKNVLAPAAWKPAFHSAVARAIVLPLPFLCLLVWFRYEQFFHSHLAVLVVWIAIAFLIGFLLIKVLQPCRGKYAIVALWLLISGMFLLDLIQLIYYWEYSEQRFSRKIDQVTEQVGIRAEKQADACRAGMAEIEIRLRRLRHFTPESVFIHLQTKFSPGDLKWAVYDASGVLLAWHGHFPSRETYLPVGTEELSVANLLHQHFLKLKRATEIQGKMLLIVVLKPFAAEYSIENRFLSNYNLLTDGLAIRPDLLYNSRQSTAASPDLVLRTIQVSQDFAISAVYKKQQFGDFLIARIFTLHWWIEVLALAFFLFTIVHLFFEFVGVSGQTGAKKEAILSWLILFAVSLLAAMTTTQFSAFGSRTVFETQKETVLFFRSPGSFALTSFLLLNLALSLVLLARKLTPQITITASIIRYLALIASVVFSGVLLSGYYQLLQQTLTLTPFDPVDLSILRLGVIKLAQIYGMLWLDLAFVLFVGVMFAFALHGMSRSLTTLVVLVGSIMAVSAVFVVVHNAQTLGFVVPSLVLLFGPPLLVFFLPGLWSWFQRINLVSRFLVLLIVFTFASSLFYAIRFQFGSGMQRTYIEREAAAQVAGQENVLEKLLTASQAQLDQAIDNISVDPRIPDLGYRLWTRTDLGRQGYQSAVEIYDTDGKLLNRFSLGLPRLTLEVSAIAQDQEWTSEQRYATFGSFRKPIRIGVRPLNDVGYLVIQTAQDYENLPFIASSNPFQELFRPKTDPRLYIGSPYLNVYDENWRPVFVSNAEYSLPARRASILLRNRSAAWAKEHWSGRDFNIYYFRLTSGYGALLVPAVSFRTHAVHVIDLLLFHLTWFSLFTLVLVAFFRPYLALHFETPATTRFNFFQKLLFAFFIFAIVPMLFLSLVIRNYVWEKKIEEVTSRALNSFSVATKVVGDYLFYRIEGQPSSPRGQLFSNELLEWIGQVIQQDISLYYDRYLLAASNRDLFNAGLLGEQLSGKTYVDLFLRGQKYSISEMNIGSLEFLNVSGRVYTGRFKDEVVTLPFLIDEKSVEAEIVGLREYMMLAGAGLMLFAVFLGYFLANRFTRPVQVLIRGTGEMSRGNLRFRIREHYPDEFQQLVDSFNTMARSLNENQDALERRRAYIENILNNITTGVVSIDSTTKVTTINPAASRMFGTGPDHRGSLAEWIPATGQWSAVREVIQKFLDRMDAFQVREVSVSRGDQEKHFRLVYVPLFEEQVWNGAVLLVEDITDIIRSNRLSAWAEMARRVAHEVKNPLTPIQLAIEHMVKVYEDQGEDFDEVLRSCSDAVLKQVKTLRRLVSDFSQYGRPAVLNKTDVDLHSFLSELVENYREHLPEGIAMEARLDRAMPAIRMDAEKIRGALMNIIENGLQAMNGAGKILLEAGALDGQGIVIRVRDTGQGILPEIVPRLFEPYFSTKSGGTGLGLAIARKSVEDHGGKIQVESEPGKGTTVSISLPA